MAWKIHVGRACVPFLAALLLNGCVGGGAPADPYDLGPKALVATGGDGSIEGPLPGAGSAQSHFPLVSGATWTFHHTSVLDEPWDETDSVSETTYEGQPAFVLSDQEDAEGEQTHSTLIVDGTRVYRAYKEVAVGHVVAVTTTYEPAFLRYDEAWTENGLSVTLDDDWTQICVVASTASSCATGAVKVGTTTHTYTVLDVDDELTVPAGTFRSVKLQRDNVSDPETKLFWFAAGVGKIREENPSTGAVSELTAYEIP
ncbi:MAG TPA: hypothetical protein VHP33_24410 [Polyangiaceae bacterium]|nr:hypothetical protein [Polyangiaceae bacterium]